MIGQLISILEAGYPAFLEVLETFDYALGKAILFGWFRFLILDSHILTCTGHDSYFSLMSYMYWEDARIYRAPAESAISSRLASITAYRCMHLIYYLFIMQTGPS